MKIIAYKINNDKTIGFYDSEIHEFILKKNEENVLEEGYIEIENEERERLLDLVSNGMGEIRILKTGNLGIYKKPKLSSDIVKPLFNYETEKWEETATLEEQLEFFKNQIIQKVKVLNEIKQAGFNDVEIQQEIEKIELKHKTLSHLIGLEINKIKVIK